ncbi:ABC transporter ATP-binding protein [Romboutsia maritimum]|uniref:ABC transporter ATP-binding protein n=1 Tax=Romboutsia maritimum TaxID=2020948 RepID=A0A371IQP7_9FIRM|nr:ABC transporter ATP-binding protein [Romboutsia maritimum]RDY22796.1 ABC transporter ATP-binding protein [Romboutsia maritimum]
MNKINIKVENLYYKYTDNYEALKGINFFLREGESVGIVGSNGAGKSTLLLQLIGILLPTKGNIFINDNIINKKNLHIIRKDIGFVFQNPEDQLFTTSVYDDVAFGPRNYKLDKDEVDHRVINSLKKVGIEDLKDKAPYRLSGGQKNLAAIATAISMNPSILIMDEPTSALDPRARRRLINLLNEFNYTKIIATHDLDMVLDTCERTIILKNGKIVADGLTKDILMDEKLMDLCELELPLSIQGIKKYSL